MKCPKCNHKIENNKISHALHLRLADSFDNEVENVEKNGKIRLTLLAADTPDTEIEDIEIEHQSVFASCPYCGYKGTISSFYGIP
jgi:hypothetical protein